MRLLTGRGPAPAGIETGECVAGPCAGRARRALPVSVERGYVMLDERVPLEEPADLGR